MLISVSAAGVTRRRPVSEEVTSGSEVWASSGCHWWRSYVLTRATGGGRTIWSRGRGFCMTHKPSPSTLQQRPLLTLGGKNDNSPWCAAATWLHQSRDCVGIWIVSRLWNEFWLRNDSCLIETCEWYGEGLEFFIHCPSQLEHLESWLWRESVLWVNFILP